MAETDWEFEQTDVADRLGTLIDEIEDVQQRCDRIHHRLTVLQDELTRETGPVTKES